MTTQTTRYPRTLAISGQSFTLRPLVRGDEHELAAFFRQLPVDDRRMLKDDVTNALVIASWCSNINYDKVLPLLAFAGGRVVSVATLHRSGGWSQHVAKIRVTVHPDHRGHGLGRAVVGELVDLAGELKISMLDAEVMSEQKGGLKLFEELGFLAVATLPQHVLDLKHQAHDLVVMSKTLIPPERLSPDAYKSSEEVEEGGDG